MGGTSFGCAQGRLCPTLLMLVLVSRPQRSKATDRSVRPTCLSHTSLWLEHPGVVLFEADRVGALVLLRVGLVFRSQLARALLAVAVDLMVERGFFGFEMGGLTCGQLSSFKFGSAMLLRARSVGALGMSTGDDCVVLLVIDGFRYMILPVLEPGAVGGGEASAIVFAHVALFGVHAGFFSFQAGGLAGGPLAVLDTGGDTLLLVLLGLLDGLLVCARFCLAGDAACLRDNGYGQRGQAGSQEHILHRGFHVSMLR